MKKPANIFENIVIPQKVLLLFALLVLLGLTFFLYFRYPETWRAKNRFKLGLLGFHLLGSISISIIFTCYASVPFPWLKLANSFLGSIYMIVIIMLAIFYGAELLLDAVTVLVCRRRMVRFSSRETVSALFIAAAFAVAVIGFVNSASVNVLSFEKTVFKTADASSMDILMISDLHAGAGTWEKNYAQIGKLVNACDPDLIVLCGDIFDETTAEKDQELVAQMLSGFHPRFGTYFVYGNHEDPQDETITALLTESNVTILKDELVLLENGVQLLGRLDPAWGSCALPELWEWENPDSSKPLVVLQHRPKELQKLSELGSDLLLAGHTHGYNVPFAPGVMLANDLVSGCKTVGDMMAVTSNGAAAWGIRYKWPSKNDLIHIHLEFEGI